LGLPEAKNTTKIAIGGVAKVNLAGYVVIIVVICVEPSLHQGRLRAVFFVCPTPQVDRGVILLCDSLTDVAMWAR
jgi:hypothetical protein